MKATSLLVRKLWPRLSFLKVGRTSRSRSRGQKLWYHVKGLITSNTHVQYEISISYGKEIMAKVNVFVYASNADAEADTRAMTLAPWTFVPAR